MKFGGTSVADATCMKRVASRIVEARKDGHPWSPWFPPRGYDRRTHRDGQGDNEKPACPGDDMLLSTGERISAALVLWPSTNSATTHLAHRVAGRHRHRHRSHQSQDPRHQAHRILKALEENKVVLVAGFQGVSTDQDVTPSAGEAPTPQQSRWRQRWRRGLHGLHRRRWRLHHRPRVCPRPAKLDVISNDEMLELTAGGAKVMMLRSIELARRFDVPLWVRSSFHQCPRYSHRTG